MSESESIKIKLQIKKMHHSCMRKGNSLDHTGRDQLQIWIRDKITLLEEIAKGRKMTCRKQSPNIKERDTDKE